MFNKLFTAVAVLAIVALFWVPAQAQEDGLYCPLDEPVLEEGQFLIRIGIVPGGFWPYTAYLEDKQRLIGFGPDLLKFNLEQFFGEDHGARFQCVPTTWPLFKPHLAEARFDLMVDPIFEDNAVGGLIEPYARFVTGVLIGKDNGLVEEDLVNTCVGYRLSIPAGFAAETYFKALEEERPGCFELITEIEINGETVAVTEALAMELLEIGTVDFAVMDLGSAERTIGDFPTLEIRYPVTEARGGFLVSDALPLFFEAIQLGNQEAVDSGHLFELKNKYPEVGDQVNPDHWEEDETGFWVLRQP